MIASLSSVTDIIVEHYLLSSVLNSKQNRRESEGVENNFDMTPSHKPLFPRASVFVCFSRLSSNTNTLRFRPLPEIEMDQVPNEILEDIINMLPVKNQLAVKIVNRKFNELALTTTTKLNLWEIPPNRWLDVAKQVPKLTSLTGFTDGYNLDPNEQSFMKQLATVNKNIINLPNPAFGTNLNKLINCYVESVKTLDQSYTGSGLNWVFEQEDYMQLLRKYPDLDIKCELRFSEGAYVRGFEDSPEEFMKKKKEFNFSHVAVLHVGSVPGVVQLLEKTVNVKELELDVTIDGESSKFHRTLEAIGKLHYLKELELTAKRNDEEIKYEMTADDYSSLRKVMSIQTLRTARLVFVLTPDHQNIYDCIIGSTNNKLDRLEVSFHGDGTFIGNSHSACRTIEHMERHQIYAGFLMEFSIVDFVHKFSNSRPRSFEIANDCDSSGFVIMSNMIPHEWDSIQTEFEQFIESHPDHKYTLERITDFSNGEPKGSVSFWVRAFLVVKGNLFG